jgi:hypothetical protein
MVAEIFKCLCCGNKYDHDDRAKETEIVICKWCAGEIT